ANEKAAFGGALVLSAADAGRRPSQQTARAGPAALAELDQPLKLPQAPSGGSGRRIALVIGNGAYAAVHPLPNPPNDARTVAKSLRAIGFEVSEGIDLDRAAMEKLMREFIRGAITARTAVVFYAGHGM